MNKVITKTDKTDHLGFFCENCNNHLNVLNVETEKAGEEPNDKVTMIHLNCNNCENKTYIKFYWKEESINFNLF